MVTTKEHFKMQAQRYQWRKNVDKNSPPFSPSILKPCLDLRVCHFQRFRETRSFC